MASSGYVECPICTEQIVDNRLLPCGHTFCLNCISQIKRSKGKLLHCPVCRKECAIPKGGFSELPRNYAVEQILQAPKQPKQEHELNMCEICDSVAVEFCMQCSQNLCTDCSKVHKKLKVSVCHYVVQIDKKEQLKDSLDTRHMYCPVHREYRLELACVDCNTLICWKCKRVNHQAHECIEMIRMADYYAMQLKADIERAEYRVHLSKKLCERIEYQEQMQQECFKKETERITKIVGKLMRDIAENQTILAKQMESVLEENLRLLHLRKENVYKHLADLQQNIEAMRWLKDCGEPWKLYKCFNDLHRKTENVLQENVIGMDDAKLLTLPNSEIFQQLLRSNSNISEIGDQPTPSTPSQQTTDGRQNYSSAAENSPHPQEVLYLGNPPHSTDLKHREIKLKQQVLPRVKPPKYNISMQMRNDTNTGADPGIPRNASAEAKSDLKKQSQLLAKISAGGQAVCGITVFEHRLYVIFDHRAVISVYDLTKFHLISKITIDSVVEPKDLTSCSFHRCLYVSEWKTSSIHRTNIEDISTITKWNIGDDFGNISTSFEHNVIVAGFRTSKIKEYTTNGRLLRSIQLTSGIHPWHALKLNSENYIVSHGNTSTSLHMVCLVNSKGDLLKSFGGKKGSGRMELNGPYHLALDMDKRVLVADCNNHRVVMLTSDLEYRGDIGQDLRYPTRVCIDKATNELCIADNNVEDKKIANGKVLIFKLLYMLQI